MRRHLLEIAGARVRSATSLCNPALPASARSIIS
jgi:hypothetical protein